MERSLSFEGGSSKAPLSTGELSTDVGRKDTWRQRPSPGLNQSAQGARRRGGGRERHDAGARPNHDQRRAMSASMQEHSSWQDYERRRRWFFATWLGYVPGAFALGYPLTRLFHSDIPFFVVAGAWMLALAVSGIYMALFPCPRCHREFFYTWWHFWNPFARRCVHCGHPVA